MRSFGFLICALFSNIEIGVLNIKITGYKNKLCSIYKIQIVQKGLKREVELMTLNILVYAFLELCVCVFFS